MNTVDLQPTQEHKTYEVDPAVIFEKEFTPHMDALYNYAYRLTRNADDAEDLLQDVLMRSYRYAHYYEPGSNAKSWLFRMMNNHFINLYRKKSKSPEKVEFEAVDFKAGEQSTDLKSFYNSIGDEMLSSLNALPDHLRSIVLLSDVEGFKYEEISKIMDIPLGTVKTWIHKARNVLKDKLSDYYGKHN